MTKERTIAVDLRTQRTVDVLGSTFDHLWPVDDSACFSQLLQAIDEADRELGRTRDDKD